MTYKDGIIQKDLGRQYLAEAVSRGDRGGRKLIRYQSFVLGTMTLSPPSLPLSLSPYRTSVHLTTTLNFRAPLRSKSVWKVTPRPKEANAAEVASGVTIYMSRAP
jgi:hypothetical protein